MKTMKFLFQLMVVGAVALLFASCEPEHPHIVYPEANENVCVYEVLEKISMPGDRGCYRFAFRARQTNGRIEHFWVTMEDWQAMNLDNPVYNYCFDYICSGVECNPCKL